MRKLKTPEEFDKICDELINKYPMQESQYNALKSEYRKIYYETEILRIENKILRKYNKVVKDLIRLRIPLKRMILSKEIRNTFEL